MKRIFGRMIIAAAAMLAVSCTFGIDEHIVPQGNGSTMNFEVEIPESVAARTRALSSLGENAVQHIDILAFTGDKFSYITSAKTIKVEDNRLSFQADVSKSIDHETYRLVILANVDSDDLAALNLVKGTTTMEQIQTALTFTSAARWNDGSPLIPMWGEFPNTIEVSATTTGADFGQAAMMRAVAKVDLRNTDTRFDLQSVWVCNAANSACVVPAAAHVEDNRVMAPSVPSAATTLPDFEVTTSNEFISNEIYLAEKSAAASLGAADALHLIIKGVYGSDAEPTFYRMDFALDGVPVAILRNHKYEMVLTELGGSGARNIEDAVTPINGTGATVTVWDDTPDITTDGVYSLGLSRTSFAVSAAGSTETLTYRTDSTGPVTATVSVDWITSLDHNTENHSVGFTVAENTSGVARTSTITITVGRITREITVYQSSGVETLSLADRTANCYVVSSAGEYSFDADVAGTGMMPDGTVAAALIDDASFYGAALLWTTGPVLDGVVLHESVRLNSDKTISFLTTGGEGSAIIALYRRDFVGDFTEIVWTWHIWATADLADQTIGNNTVQNLNLGATSTDLTDPDCYGHSYQWGRKDPTIGSAILGGKTNTSYVESSAFTTAATKTSSVNTAIFGSTSGISKWAVGAAATRPTFAKSPKTPMYHYNSNAPYSDATTANAWITSFGWKTMYDPCPAGYRVPTSTELTAMATALNGGTFALSGTTNGHSYSLDGQTVGLPAQGTRYLNGRLYRVGYIGCYWSSTEAATGTANYAEFTNAAITSSSVSKCSAQALRCVVDNRPVDIVGNGTEQLPYKIYTLSDLELYRDKINDPATHDAYASAHYELANDIDMAGTYDATTGVSWTPIGNASCRFMGTFDGNGKTISNLYIDAPTLSDQGLFGNSDSATIKDLTLSGGSVTGNNFVGALCGTSRLTIENCHSSVNVTGSYSVGGMAGIVMDTGAIINCSNYGNITSTDSAAGGGIAGYSDNSSTSIVNCYNQGTVNAPQQAGGICGLTNAGQIRNCYNVGTISLSSSYNTKGGILGDGNSGSVQNSYYLAATGMTGIGGTSSVADVAGRTTSMTDAVMKGNDFGKIVTVGGVSYVEFLNMLNAGAYAYNSTSPTIPALGWMQTADTYPVFGTEPPAARPATDFAERGTGTASDPYQIWTLTDLEYYRDRVNDTEAYRTKFYKMMDNIDMGTKYNATTDKRWIPIGIDATNSFNGTFYGNDKTISNLYASGGLFGYCTSLTVDKLTLEGGNVVYYNGDATGSLAAYVIGVATVTSCVSSATVSGDANVGGLIGEVDGNYSVIDKCIFTGTVTGGNSHTGGIVARFKGERIINCTNRGSVTGYYSGIGGIVGILVNSDVYNSANHGDIASTASYNLGGIVGRAYNTTETARCEIKNCFNTGACPSYTSNDLVSGGVVGAVPSNGYFNINNNYFLSTTATYGIGYDTKTSPTYQATSVTEDRMKGTAGLLLQLNATSSVYTSFLSILNAGKPSGSLTWTQTTGQYPELAYPN